MTPRLTPEQLGQPIDETAQALSIARFLVGLGVPLFLAKPALGDDGQWDPLGGANHCGYWLPARWQKSTPDLGVVDRWKPGLALCAVMGQGLDVLDIDPRNGGDKTAERWKAEGIYPKVYATAATPSGGTHDFIASLGVKTKHHEGIDIQAGAPGGEGRGLVFLAPTVKVSKATGEIASYRWEVSPC
ncbi:MAG: bifunctional DNA primase/polymerase [Protaetiibacter sp.]